MRVIRHGAVHAGLAWCALGRVAGAQLPGLAVDPPAVVLTPEHPGSRVTVYNPRATPVSIDVALRFGYVTVDSTDGTARVELGDDHAATSAATWIAAYPSRFTLEPGASRAVRLLARPPESLADGEYWARIVLHARDAQQPDASSASHDTDFATAERNGPPRVRLTLETATVMPLFYRKGNVSTGIEVDELAATADHDGIDIHAALRRTGNAAYLGRAHVSVRDSAGREIAAADRTLAVYERATPHWRVRVPARNLERCSVSVVLSTRRDDVPRGTVLQSAPVLRTMRAELVRHRS